MFDSQIPPAQMMAVIAGALAGIGSATQRIGGTIGFRIQGPHGGDWLVDLSQPGGCWSRPDDPQVIERATTTIYAYAQPFQDLITHPEQLEHWMKSGALEVDGDRTRLSLLGRLLGAGGSILQQRARLQQRSSHKSNKNSNERTASAAKRALRGSR